MGLLNLKIFRPAQKSVQDPQKSLKNPKIDPKSGLTTVISQKFHRPDQCQVIKPICLVKIRVQHVCKSKISKKQLSVSIKIHIATKYTISSSKSETIASKITRLILNSIHVPNQNQISNRIDKSQLWKIPWVITKKATGKHINSHETPKLQLQTASIHEHVRNTENTHQNWKFKPYK